MSLIELQCKSEIPLDIVDKHEALLTFLCFKNFEDNFPLLSKKSKNSILNILILRPVILYIDEIKILDFEVNFPSSLPVLKNLKKITIDDYNINNFLQNWNLFPNIRELEIHSSVDISLEDGIFSGIERLTIVNTVNEIKPAPKLSCKNLEYLFLSGFSVEFVNKLPSVLVLEDCIVRRSENLPGCNSLTLTSSFWKFPSVPVDELFLDESDYSTKITSLKVLHLRESKISTNLQEISGLRELKFIRTEPTFENMPDTIEKFIYDFSSPITGLIWANNVKELILRDLPDEFEFPVNLQRLTISNSKLSYNFLSGLKKKKRLEFLKIVYSSLDFFGDLDCNAKLLVISNSDFVHDSEIIGCDKVFAYNCQNLVKTPVFRHEIFQMSKKDFILLCRSLNYKQAEKVLLESDLRLLRILDYDKWQVFNKIFNLV